VNRKLNYNFPVLSLKSAAKPVRCIIAYRFRWKKVHYDPVAVLTISGDVSIKGIITCCGVIIAGFLLEKRAWKP
jgi:hypothetical protein